VVGRIININGIFVTPKDIVGTEIVAKEIKNCLKIPGKCSIHSLQKTASYKIRNVLTI
jgi:hypothetical protein